MSKNRYERSCVVGEFSGGYSKLAVDLFNKAGSMVNKSCDRGIFVKPTNRAVKANVFSIMGILELNIIPGEELAVYTEIPSFNNVVDELVKIIEEYSGEL